MRKETAEAIEQPSSRTKRPSAPQLRMPDNIHSKFGVQVHDDLQAQGIVATSDIADLVKAFGVSDVGSMSFPFQKHGASDGKKYELRVEPSGSHNMAGEPIVGHQWIFRQTYPEMTA